MSIDIEQYKVKEEPFYQPQSNEVELYQAAYNRRLPVMVKGPTGCGKSRFIEYMAWKLGKPLITVACNEDLTASESLNQVPEGCEQSILQLCQEAVALLGWAIQRLGDEFAISGFSSNTRHEVRYQHIKGYGEQWDDRVERLPERLPQLFTALTR